MSRRLIVPLVALIVGAAVVGVVLGVQRCSSDMDYMSLDEATGLHNTGTPVEVDIDTYRLVVTGKVDKELSLTYDEILGLPRVTGDPDLVCPGYFVDKATWSGAGLKSILDLAGVQSDAVSVRLNGADGYHSKVDMDVALASDSFLAFELDGKTLPVSQGFPLRAVFPNEEGSHWIKWIVELVVE